MLEEKPVKAIVRFSLPILFGLLFQQIYTTADTAIVSRILGPEALAAVGCLNSVNFLILGFCNGMGSGFGIPIAQAFGANKSDDLKKYLGNMIWLYLLFSIVVTVISALLCNTILRVTNTQDNIYTMAYIYMFTIFCGIPFQFGYNTMAGLLRSLGDSKNPLYILIFCSVLNIGLDLFMICVLNWSVFGAAFATILSQGISAIGCVIILIKNYPEYRIQKQDLKISSKHMTSLLKNSIPMGFMMSVCGIGSLILQSSINTLGSSAIAAITAGEKIGQLLQSITSSLGSSLTVFCGQNLGAGRVDRINEGVKGSVWIAMIFCFACIPIIFLFGKYLVYIFIDSSNVELVNLTIQYLRILIIFFFGAGLIHTVRFALQGMGYPNVALIASILEMIARGVIGLFVIPSIGFMGACFSNPLAWLMAIAYIIPMYFMTIKKLEKIHS